MISERTVSAIIPYAYYRNHGKMCKILCTSPPQKICRIRACTAAASFGAMNSKIAQPMPIAVKSFTMWQRTQDFGSCGILDYRFYPGPETVDLGGETRTGNRDLDAGDKGCNHYGNVDDELNQCKHWEFPLERKAIVL